MRNIVHNHAIKKVILLVLMLCFLFILSACESVDKDDASLSIQQTEFEYHEETDITTVYFTVEVQNNTIYNISSYEVDLGAYCNGESIEIEPLSYNHKIKHGSSDRVNLTFTAKGEVDRVALSTWTPHFETIWKTHINAIIALVAIIILGVVLYFIAIF